MGKKIGSGTKFLKFSSNLDEVSNDNKVLVCNASFISENNAYSPNSTRTILEQCLISLSILFFAAFNVLTIFETVFAFLF